MQIKAIVFDAYGTLFDVAAAARMASAEPGGEILSQIWPALAEDWRRKQLEYTWLRAIMGLHADFGIVTAEALDWAMERHDLAGHPGLRDRLLSLYDRLAAFPEVPSVLKSLKEQGLRLAILSNGSPAMLSGAVGSAGIEAWIDACLSVEEVGIYKPAAAVYAMVEHHLGLPPEKVLFVSSNGWDIAGAARFGFHTAWINRAGLPVDRLPHGPEHRLSSLSPLTDLIKSTA